jgi:hypothetical protein
MNSYLRRTDTDYLIGLPSINAEAALQIRQRSWPDDEEQTTREIYEAAEIIRGLRPRHPVGYAPAEFLEVVQGSLAPMDRRCSKGLRT